MADKICVVGSLNMDLVVRAEHIPVPGETILGGEFNTFPGGKGANQAVAAARLGGTVSMVGKVGKDKYSDTLLEMLTASQVNSTYVFQDKDYPTGIAMIIVDEAGNNSIVVASGSNMQLSPADIQQSEKVIKEASVLVLQLESPLDTVISAAKIAKDNEVKVILNPAPAQHLPDELLNLVDVLIPNEIEVMMLAGLTDVNCSDIEFAAKDLMARGIDAVVVTLGSRGALVIENGESTLLPAYVVNVVDTTAAGDAFIGGFAVAFAEGRSLLEAVSWGNVSGALAATKIGAITSLPSRSDLDQVLIQGNKNGEKLRR